MLDDLTAAQQRLANFMSELSERSYFAAWMDGLELALWDALQHGPRKYGELDLTPQHLARLKELSTECGGWIYFDDEHEELFASFAEWQHMWHRLGGLDG